VFEKRVLRTIFGPTKEKVTEHGKNCSMKSSIVCTLFKYYWEYLIKLPGHVACISSDGLWGHPNIYSMGSSPSVRQPRYPVNHSPPSSDEVKNE
jgi:hypothetical protein